MFTKTAGAPFATSAERGAPGIESGSPGERGLRQDPTKMRKRSIEVIGLAAAVVATLVMYTLFIVYPVPHEPLSAFLAHFARGNAAIWPMQLLWYAAAAAIIGLALWPIRRSTQMICLLAAAYVAWIGVAYFGVLDQETHAGWVSWLLAGAFMLEGILLLVAGVIRRDLVIAPRWDRWDLASILGAVFIGYALVAYPVLGLLGGHPLASLPLFGFSPCATAFFCFGLLLWAQRPAPIYLLPIPLAWALVATPGAMATGVVPDLVLALAGVATALVLLWRDRSSSWRTFVAGVALTVLIALSGHDDMLTLAALALVAVTLVQTFRGSAAQPVPGHNESRAPAPAGSSSGAR